MKRIFRLLPVMLVLLAFTTGCNNSMSNMGPKEVLVSFFEKISKKDIDGASKLATKDSKATLDMMKKAMDMGDKMKDNDMKKDDPTEDFKSMEVGDAKIDGDMATVAVKNKKKDSEVEFPLKKEDGAWKVDFSMSTLMKMGMDASHKHNMDGGNGYDSTMENIDPEKMKKGLEMADSMMKKMDPEKMKEAMKALDKLKENK